MITRRVVRRHFLFRPDAAINQLLIHQSIASRQRNVMLRNDGQGGFDDHRYLQISTDEVYGSLPLDRPDEFFWDQAAKRTASAR